VAHPKTKNQLGENTLKKITKSLLEHVDTYNKLLHHIVTT